MRKPVLGGKGRRCRQTDEVNGVVCDVACVLMSKSVRRCGKEDVRLECDPACGLVVVIWCVVQLRHELI